MGSAIHKWTVSGLMIVCALLIIYAVHASPAVPAVGADMNCPGIVGSVPDVLGAADGIHISCFAAPTSIGPTGPTGATGSAGAAGANGTNGTNGATGAAGAAGIVCYNSSGVITGCKQWVGTATVNSSGVWTVSVASAGFSSVAWSQFSSTAPANGGSVNIATGSCTTSTCSGTATGALNVLGILTLSLSNINGSVISIQVVGS